MSDEDQGNNKVEAEAREFGWVAKEEFRGPEEQWVDAESFVKRGKEINPILRKNNETLLKKLEEARGEIETVKKVAKEFQQFQKDSYDKKKQELDTQIRQLNAAKADAITSNDGERYAAIETAIDTLKEEKTALKAPEPVKDTPTQPQQDPVLTNWITKGGWYGQDVKKTHLANAASEELRRNNPTLVGQAFLDKLDSNLAEEYPEVFVPKKKAVPDVEGSSRAGRSGGGGGRHSFENLPADAQAACNRFIKQGLIKNKEAYLAEYEW